MKSWLEKNDTEVYSTDNERKPVAAERLIKTFKKILNTVSKNVYIDKLDNIVNKYNNTYHRAIKMKPFDVKSNTYIDFSNKINIMVLILKLVILLEHQNIKTFLQKVTLQIGLKKLL